MSLITAALLLFTIIVGIVECHFTSPSLAENIFLPKDIRSDPYEDNYVQTIFRMNKKELMAIPKLDDDVFLYNLERNIDDIPTLLVTRTSTIFDDKLDDQLVSQRDIEEKWEDLVVAGPITVNYLSNLMIVASKKDFALVLPTPNYIYNGEVDNTAFENAKKKAELALQRLKEAQGIYDQWYAKMLEKQNKLTGIIFQLSQLDMNTVDHQTVINILVSATKEVIHIQEQWDKMIRFFAKLSMQAEHTQQTILFEFIAVIQAADLASGMLDDADREFYVMLLLETANEIDRGAHLLYIMSKTYYDVSYQYMMSQIAGISRLILTQTNQERESLMKQIAQDTLSASARVSRMALERRQQYEQRNQERQEVYERFIQQATLEELQSTIGK
ncbi:unnamed protein product [Rotaria sordida]|uniref:Uncharacterized protein n=1 Tax=Rotaria sordida TaxID=392033 RepID=A0A815L6D9_9BILA|nr:unnamed protein product [Rotaria sordida]